MLAARLPARFDSDPDLQLLTANETARAVTLVQFIYKSKNSAGGSKDYEFSRSAIDAGAENLLRLATRVDADRHGGPAILAVITGWGYGYRRSDGVSVIPIGALAP